MKTHLTTRQHAPETVKPNGTLFRSRPFSLPEQPLHSKELRGSSGHGTRGPRWSFSAVDPQGYRPVHQFELPLGAAAHDGKRETPVGPPAHTTGLPASLQVGLERLSGLAMDTVKVHYNSAKPAAVQALAYTQGTHIYIGPGQEKHLPHEAWHVVQQAQGRVQPNLQAKEGALNDDTTLEHEADVMGAQAMQTRRLDQVAVSSVANAPRSEQRGRVAPQTGARADVIQRATYRNIQTGRVIDLTEPVGKDRHIDARETQPRVWMRPQMGAMHIALTDDTPPVMELHTIHVTPERKSGLGILLMAYLADIAASEKCQRIDILTPAVPVVRYYEKLGAEPLAASENERTDLFESINKIETMIAKQPGSREDAWKRIVGIEAEQKWEREGYDHPAYVEWKNLLPSQRESFTRRVATELQREGEKKVEARIQDWIHGKAVGGATLTVSPVTMKKHLASSMKQWQKVSG